MTTYTSAVQQQLIAALKNRQLTTLDFSHYIPEPPENLTFAGHTGQVLELAILPNGQMVSVGYDKTLRVWDASTGQCLKILKMHKEGVGMIAVLPNGYIVSGSCDYTLRVWDVSRGTCLKTLTGHTSQVTCIAVQPNSQVVSGSNDGTVRVWDVTTGQCLQILKGHTSEVKCLAVLPNSQLVSSSSYNPLRVWDVATGQCLKTIEWFTGQITCLAVLSNGQLVGGTSDNSYALRVWDVSRGTCLKTLTGHRHQVTCLAVLPNHQVVSGSWDNTLRVWDLSTGQRLQTLKGHTDIIFRLVVLPNGQVVSGSRDQTLRVWDVRTGQCLKTLEGHTDAVNLLEVLPNGQVVSGSFDSTLKSWTIAPRHCYEAIAPVLQAITPECGLQELALRGLDLGQVGYEHLLELVQNVSSLQSLDLRNTDLVPVQIDTLQQIVNQHRIQEEQRKAQIRAAQNRLLQAQAERIRHLETQLLTILEGEPYLHTQVQTEEEQQLQKQAKRIRHLETQLLTILEGEPYLHTRVQTKKEQILQKQAERIGQLETQLKTTLQAEHDIRAQYQQQQAQAQVQAKRLQELETQMQRLQVQYVQQESSSLLTYPEITFTCPVIEQPYHRIEEESIPDEFLCPITRQIMWEPVMADDGYTYERDIIEAHFQRSVTSPMLPEEPLPSQRLVMNRNVRAAIQRLLERHLGWVLHQPDAVYFSSAYEAAVQAAVAANDRAALLRAIDQEPRLLTRSLTQGLLIEQVWHQAELLEAVVQHLTPAMWSHVIQKAGGISHWLGKLAGLALPSLASQLQGFTIFLQALQTGLSCEYPTKALIAQGLHQSLPVLLLLGLHRLSGINSSLDAQQNTALHYAAASGDLPLVTALVEQEATITLKNKAGQTPKALAQLAGHDKVVAYCQQIKLQPLMSQLLGNLGLLNIPQHQELREMVHQQQKTILQLQTQIQAQEQELQYLRGAHSSSLLAVTPTGN